MKRRKTNAVLWAGVAVLSTIAVLLGTVQPATNLAAAASMRATADCAQSPSSFLTENDLGAFTRMVTLRFTKPPWKGSRPGAPAPLFYTAYRDGRMVGYIANIALTGPDVPAERARERKLGYKGKWPLVPLDGPVVRHNPGLLEVYETIHSFKTLKAAKSWISFDRGSQRTDPNSHLVALPSGAPDGVAWAGTMGPDKPDIEHEVYYNVRFGTRVLEVALQGGSSVDPALVEPYWQQALERFTQSCG